MTDKRDGKAIKKRRRIITALFEESGDIAPIDFGRFGKCVGEIIAQAAQPQRKAKSRRQH